MYRISKSDLNKYSGQNHSGQSMVETLILAQFVFIILFVWLVIFYNLFDLKYTSLESIRYILWERTEWAETGGAARPYKSDATLRSEANQKMLNVATVSTSNQDVYDALRIAPWQKTLAFGEDWLSFALPGRFSFVNEGGYYTASVSTPLEAYAKKNMDLQGIVIDALKEGNFRYETRGALITNTWKARDAAYVKERIKESYSRSERVVFDLIEQANKLLRVLGLNIDIYRLNQDSRG